MRNILIAVGAVVALFLLFAIWQFLVRPTFFGGQGKVTVNSQTFTVDVAKTSEAQEKGLSGRNSLSENRGMLFVFSTPDAYSFWMKGMKFPIDIIFINGDTVNTVYKNVQPPASENETPPLYRPNTPSDKVLEVSGGLADKYGIKPGDTVTTSL